MQYAAHRDGHPKHLYWHGVTDADSIITASHVEVPSRGQIGSTRLALSPKLDTLFRRSLALG